MKTKLKQFNTLLFIALIGLFSCKKEVVEKDTNIYEEEYFGEETFEMPTGAGGSLPSKVDLSGNLPKISDQGAGTSTCVAFALINLKSYHEQSEKGGSFTSDKTFSPMFIYNHIKISDCESGTRISKGLNFLKTTGVCNWSYFTESLNCYAQPNNDAYINAQKYKIKSFERLDGLSISKSQLINSMKYSLFYKQPLISSIEIDEEFMKREKFSWGDWVWRENKSKILNKQYHAVLIVGYDDNINAFLIMNSFGSGWKNNGYCWVDYNFFTDKQKAVYVTYDEIENPNNGGGGTGGGNSNFADINASYSNFGDVNINESKTTTVSIVNSGTSTLTITDIGVNHSEFSFVNYPSFPINISAGSTYYLNVKFNPKSIGVKDCQISIFSNAKSGTKYLSISGTGIQQTQNSWISANFQTGSSYGCYNYGTSTWSDNNYSFNVNYGYFSSKISSLSGNLAKINFDYCNNISGFAYGKISFMFDYNKNNYWTSYDINQQFTIYNTNPFEFKLDWWLNTNEKQLRIIPIIAAYDSNGGFLGFYSSPEIILTKN